MSSKVCEWTAGMIVRSTAGNDAGRYYIILSAEGKRCLVTDGRHRKLCRPKAKNIKHLESAGKEVDLAECNTDRKIRHALTGLQFGGSGAFSE